MSKFRLYDVLKGTERRSIIAVTDGSTRYIAESGPGADPTEAVWLCSKNSVDGNVEKLQVLDTLQAPGTDGELLAAMFGD